MQEQVLSEVGFSVDAGLIQRLGYELVGKAETAVSELIKNSYDADATTVEVSFIDTEEEGGTLIIEDNGSGMTRTQLLNGFMRISSSDKLHNPTSSKYKRTKAGRKGIGRFAAQRLGKQLTIITQSSESEEAIRLSIDWNEFYNDRDLTSIKFPLEYEKKAKDEGTTLIIRQMRDKWTEASISRVYRYVMDLFQPDYLSDYSKNHQLASRGESFFKVNFYQTLDNEKTPILNEQTVIFDKALAVFEGFIDQEHKGIVRVRSKSLDIEDTISLYYDEKKKTIYNALSNVSFKIYYFIYNRPQYYGDDGISRNDLKQIERLSQNASGVRLYRNGFRVLPYGEPSDDWTNIDKRWSSESGVTNIPFSNKNLFGFVEIIDAEGASFEETASREGLIENEAFVQLSEFIHIALKAARGKVAERITLFKEKLNNDDYTTESDNKKKNAQELIDGLKKGVNKLQTAVVSNRLVDSEVNNVLNIISQFEGTVSNLLEETGMLRVLAGLGLTIGEFTHEIKQFQPTLYGHILQLRKAITDAELLGHINALNSEFDSLFEYTKFFSSSISNNTSRGKEPIDLLEFIELFRQSINNDLSKNIIDFEVSPYDYDIETIPMHKSEWSSILYNLYTNSRKAIKRAQVLGKILIEIGLEGNDIYLNFQDNGDGIPEENRNRVFNAFFSTSTPSSFNAPQEEQLVGTGLGLKIIKDIVLSYNGRINLIEATQGYSTCFQIIIPNNI